MPRLSQKPNNLPALQFAARLLHKSQQLARALARSSCAIGALDAPDPTAPFSMLPLPLTSRCLIVLWYQGRAGLARSVRSRLARSGTRAQLPGNDRTQ